MEQAMSKGGVRTRIRRAADWPPLLAALVALAQYAPAAGQAPLEKAAAPINVEVKPSPAAIGSKVSISGTSLVLDGLTTIQIAVHPPQGNPVPLTAQLDAGGEFTTSYTVATGGSYKFVATSPDGKATAEATVSVIVSPGVTEQSAQAIQQLVAETKEGVTTLGEQVAQQAPSPPQAELVEKLDALAAGLEQAPAVKLRQSMIALDKLVQQHPAALAELQPVYDALADAGGSAEEMTPELRKRLQELTVDRLCEDIHAAGEALGFVSLAMSVTLSPITTLVNVLVDKTLPDRVLSQVPELAANPGDKFVVAEVIKQAYGGAQGFASFLQAQVGLLNDVAQFATESMFRAYCEKYEGPISALFHLEYFEQGERWYAYDVTLSGKLVLRYQKGGTGDEIPVRGEFEGSATKFTVWENLSVLQPAVRSYLVERRAFPPVAVAAPGELGQFGNIGASKLGAPGVYYFNVPVAGIIRGDEVALKFEDARADYDSHAKAKVIYIFMEPLLPIPQLYVGEFPYFGAHYILTRATRREPVFKVTMDKTRSRFTRTFEREENQAGSYLVRWKLDVEACNPSC
jgi:hypothetical protein